MNTIFPTPGKYFSTPIHTDWLDIGFSKAFLGKIYPAIRLIAYHYRDDDSLVLNCIFDHEPTADDYHNMQEILDELGLALSKSDLEKIASFSINCVYFTEGPLNIFYDSLGKRRTIVYQRREDEFRTGYDDE